MAGDPATDTGIEVRSMPIPAPQRKFPVLLIDCSVVFLAALLLRCIDLSTLNPIIDDLGARQGLIALDIRNGIFHFPFSGFLLEFDEPGLAYLLTPWTFMFGFHWSVFQIFAAISGAIAALITCRFGQVIAGRWTGFLAGVCYAALPHMLRWNRIFFMSGGDWLNITTMLTILILLTPSRPRPVSLLAAGAVMGAGMVLSSIILIALPAILVTIRFKTCDRDRSNPCRVCYNMLLFVGGLLAASAPIIQELFRQPYYLFWRQRHLTINADNPLGQILSNTGNLLSELLFHTHHFLNQPANIILMGIPVTAAVILSFFFLRPRREPMILINLIYILTWIAVMALVQIQNWRGPYYILVMPFLFVLAGFGSTEFYKRIPLTPGLRKLMATVLIFAFYIHAASLFFKGPFRMNPPPNLLPLLQKDLAQFSDRPLLCSSSIPGVSYYHMPFWLITRSCVSQVSIFSFNRSDNSAEIDNILADFVLTSEPDGAPLLTMGGESQTVNMLLLPGDLNLAQKLIDGSNMELIPLKNSGLVILPCSLPLSSFAKRTWTLSAIPPIIGLDRED